MEYFLGENRPTCCYTPPRMKIKWALSRVSGAQVCIYLNFYQCVTTVGGLLGKLQVFCLNLWYEKYS
jgi:hypothetical protein